MVGDKKVEQTSEQKPTDKKIPDAIHLQELKELKSIHPQINNLLEKYLAVLERHIDPIKESMQNAVKFRKKMNEQMGDEYYGDYYSNIPLISDTIPNFRDAQLDFNTKVERQKSDLYKFIHELISESNNIKEKIVTKPIVQKQEGKTEQEIKAFENKQRDAMMDMEKVTQKAEFNRMKNDILKMAKTEEEKIITNNIALDLFGKKLEEKEWHIGRRKKITN